MNKISKIFLILIIILVTKLYGQQDYWIKIGNFTSKDLFKCSFVDTLNGWAAGDSGIILRTTNSGYNWVIQNSQVIENIIDIQFINERLGWALAISTNPNFWGTIILKTTNGGLNWDTTRYNMSEIYFKTIHFRDSLTGYLGSGNPAVIWKTTNAGVNWFECFIDTTSIFGKFSINKFRFLNDSFGMACGGIFDISGVVWKTTNYGNYWTAEAVSLEPNFDMKIFSTEHIITIGGDYEYGASLASTTNGGVKWEYMSLEIIGIPRDLEFRTEAEGWSPLGYTPVFVRTSDYGFSWDTISTPENTLIFDIAFVNNKFGVGVGTNGTVIRFNSSTIGINEKNEKIPESVNLYQNYPNPFNTETNINFEISEINYIELKIYNILGQEIELLKSDEMFPGSYTIKYSAKNLPSGIYFYKLYAKSLKNGKENIKIKKMILLK